MFKKVLKSDKGTFLGASRKKNRALCFICHINTMPEVSDWQFIAFLFVMCCFSEARTTFASNFETQNLAEEATVKFIEIFSSSGCVVHFAAELPHSNCTPNLLPLSMLAYIGSLYVVIRNSLPKSRELTYGPIFNEIFGSMQFTTVCWLQVYFFQPEPIHIPDYGEYHPLYGNQLMNIAFNQSHFLFWWTDEDDDIYPSDRESPDYVLVTIFKPQVTKNGKDLKQLVKIPETIQSSTLIILSMQPNPIDTRDNVNWYIGSRTFSKTMFQENFSKSYSATITDLRSSVHKILRLIEIHREIPSTRAHLDTIRSQFGENKKVHHFGIDYFHSKIEGHQPCSKVLLSAIANQKAFKMHECLLRNFVDWVNTSSFGFELNQEYWGSVFEYGEILPGNLAFPYSFQSSGYRFAVVLSHDESIPENRFRQMSIIALLAPLSKLVWILCFVSFLLTFLLLTLTKRYNNWTFYLVAVFFEQERGEMKKQRSRKTLPVIVAWILGSFILRNVYTSHLSANLATPPNPDDVPTTLSEFLTTPSIFVLTTYDLLYALSLKLRVSEKYRRLNSQLLRQTASIQLQTEYNVTSLVKVISRGKSIPCSRIITSAVCSLSGRFVYLYSVGDDIENGWDPQLYSQTRYLKLILKIFGQRKIIENAQVTTQITVPILWQYLSKYFFYKTFEKFVGCMVESGIAAKFNQGYNQMLQHMMLRQVNQLGVFNNTWNLYSYSSIHVTKNQGQRNLLQDSDSYVGISFEGFSVVLTMYLYLITACVLTKFVECVWIWWNRYNFD